MQSVKTYLLKWQDEISDAFSVRDQKKPTEEYWSYAAGTGGGRTRMWSGGEIFEQGGVNFSHISGCVLPPAATQARPHLVQSAFEVVGVSVVMHPYNPYAPTVHANLRFFMSENEIFWFGGGYDLTPYYGFKEDCVHWHRVAQAACHAFGEDAYMRYKTWCDRYFYLPHRKEQRGIGGLFFDDVYEPNFELCFHFVRSIGHSFLEAYLPILDKRCVHSYTERERQFQLYRRGRYVEFNLLYDRGTLFGLQSGGRTESILMSLPPQVRWSSNWFPEWGSAEHELYEYYLKPRDWALD